ncbi:hypothetical protein BDK51DRAFT_45654 [Blyttiomyces helicus]|uniref:Uncharacterized protein n=1 Tax=Blyttiomyces helicus TaxID=388810 RepID=A0A4P9WFE3_9FUNG|nr:hypothetical protein BDK51DRAFT_45654 [Blyttiomyces helicus]|eukprot:RKO91461.1 hypothetical protein BDK51DRAFT_45654 [Blyttiomyces helicus]
MGEGDDWGGGSGVMSMDAGMAANLSNFIKAAGGLPTKAWHRLWKMSRRVVRLMRFRQGGPWWRIVELGAVGEPGGPAALGNTCDIIFAMPFNDAAVRQLVSDIVGELEKVSAIVVA